MAEKSPASTAGLVVTSRPVRMSRIGWASAAFVFVAFVVVALVEKRYNAGAWFTDSDQVATVVVGVVLAGLLVMPTRPRIVADLDSVRLRAFLGGWRTVPWELIVRVDFPRKLRFARIVLPGDEALAIYAISRWDRELAVEKMRELRALFALTHPGEQPG